MLFVAKWYTRASRVRIVIAKFDGRWKLPGGPYPIPELIALVGGILVTLFSLPRFGHPVPTALVGLGATAAAVTTMRMMPYSPVPIATRIGRIYRLYTAPISISGADDLTQASTVSVVRPQIDILDLLTADAHPASVHHQGPTEPPTANPWADMFTPEPSQASGLFA